jgi:2-keto-4-pentenoate hydratase/2-oxohepta-3-ene-1,7-dioic acid hydratase in catechol pathway
MSPTKIGRIAIGTQTLLARIDGEAAIPLLVDGGEPWADPLRMWLASERIEERGAVVALGGGRLLAPVRAPSKVVAIGLNYRDHAEEQGKALPQAPMLFNKSPGSIVGPGDEVVFRTSDSDQVDYEGELAVVIGRTTKDVGVDQALDQVLGYTICNDISARDAQESDRQYFRAKSFDTFCPLGPWITLAESIPDPQSLRIVTRVNDEVRQDCTTAQMIFGVADIVSYVSRYMTLEPGDVLTTGTPGGVGVGMSPPVFLKDGDVLEVEIEGIGVLQNCVRTSD